MQRFSLQSVVFCSVLALASVARANVHEVTQSLAMMNLGRNAGMTLDSGDGGTHFELGGSYYKLISSQVQLGLTVDFIAGGNAEFDVLGGGRFNFGSKGWRNDFFINPSVGFAKLGNNNLKFVFDVGFGKRFALLENVNYMPTFSFYYLNALRMRLDFIRFSIVW
jgi:hypothetical protein